MMIERRQMGQSGTKGSILGFGCMRLPLNSSKNDDIDEALATQTLRLAIDRGVNYVDTAYPYHSSKGFNQAGASEPFVGLALSGGYREKVLLATKLPSWLVESRADMDKFLDLQLKRLKTSQIDFYLAHNLNINVWDKLLALGLREFMDEAVRDGRIRFPSFSFHDQYPVFEKVLNGYDWVMAQIQYNYLDKAYQAGQAGLRLAAKKGLAVVIMEPLRGGFLVNQMPERPVSWLKEARPDWTLPAWGLNWLWNQPECSVVLSGLSNLTQTEENLTLAENFKAGFFTDKDEAVIDKVGAFFRTRLVADCSGCGYCLPCPVGVNIPKNLTLLNQYYLFDGDAPRQICQILYNEQVGPEEKASGCQACGECVDRCPQSLNIPDLLSQTVNLYLKNA
ncbi:MAG: aldo/keto reductase [Deltaproteobacteria bacterium]|jgi:predicted aldo/keto reductase-like oxidoreductase|nr:aldo/keto reductase [Deltaproteobacteria bacterium]